MGRRAGMLLALVTLTVVVLFWVLLDEPRESERADTLAQSDVALGGPSELPSAALTSEQEPRALEIEAAAASAAANHELPESAPPSPEVTTATLSGRVVDPNGVPLPNATLTYIPSESQRALFAGTEQLPYDLSQLPQITSDAAGGFSFELPWTGGVANRGWNTGPDLIIEHANFATTAVPCSGMSARGHDLGDVRAEPGGWFSGRVVDEHGVALAGVDVAAFVRAPRLPEDRVPYRGALEMALHDLTDASGRFRTSGLQPGKLLVEIDHPGYAHLWLSSVDGYEELHSTPGVERDLGDIVLRRGLTVAGLVTDENGAPVPDARVVVSPRDQAEAFEDYAHPDTRPWEFDAALEDSTGAEGRSDAAGRFTIAGLPEGSVAVYARAPGFLIGKHAALAAGTEQAHVVLPAGGVFELTILDAATRAPLAGVTCELFRLAFNAGAELPLPIEERGVGEFRATQAGPGEHFIQLRKQGYATSIGRTLGLASGERRELQLAMHREAAITGRVVDEHGAPLAEVSVWATDPGDDESSANGNGAPADDGTSVQLFPAEAADRTGTDGRFRLGTLAPGVVEFSIRATDRVRDNTIHTITLQAGEQRDLGDLVLALAGQVEVFAQLADGTPVPARHLDLRPQDGSMGGSGQSTDASGKAALTRLAPGDYTLSAEGTEPVPVNVRAGETTHVNLVLSAPPRVFGRVTRNGEPQVGVKLFAREDRRVTLWGRMIAQRTAHTDANGRYELELPSAEAFHVSATSSSGTRLQVLHDFAWDEQRRIDFAFESHTLHGTLHAADDGRPLVNFGIEVRPVSANSAVARANTRSDENGAWTFQDLSPGAYMLSAWDPEFAFLNAGPFSTTSEETIELVMQPGAVLHGTLTQAGVEMVPDDTPLRLESLSGAELIDRVDLAWSEAGSYRFSRLPAGSFRVFLGDARDETDVLLQAHVDLAAGETRRLDLVLPP